MARLSKSDETALEEFGLAFEEIPVVENRRTSKWDPVWDAAVSLCRRHQGKSLKVRTYNNASTAYKDAKDVNNGEFRGVQPDEDAGETIESWTAVSVRTPETFVDKHDKVQHLFAIYLTYNGVVESDSE